MEDKRRWWNSSAGVEFLGSLGVEQQSVREAVEDGGSGGQGLIFLRDLRDFLIDNIDILRQC